MQLVVQENFKLVLAVLGGAVLLSFVLTFLKGIYARVLRSGKNLKLNYGPWGTKLKQSILILLICF